MRLALCFISQEEDHRTMFRKRRQGRIGMTHQGLVIPLTANQLSERLNSVRQPPNLAGSHRRRSRTPSQTALQIARRLIGDTQPEPAAGAASARAAANACGHLYKELSRWVGREGCHAMFARALTEARSDHPALAQIRLHARSDPYVEGVAESIMANGDPPTAAALESMLAVLVDLLRRLIGNDMANQLIERSLSPGDRAGAITDRKQEEA